MTKAVPNLAALCKKIKINEHDVQGAFVLGSTGIPSASTKDSDVDVVLVVNDNSNRKWKNEQWLLQHGWIYPSKKYKEINFKRDYSGCNDYDVWIYGEETFKLLVSLSIPFAIECISLPDSSLWKKLPYTIQIPDQKNLIIQSFISISVRHLRRAGLEFEYHENNFYSTKQKTLKIEPWILYKSKKTLFFSLRFIEMARQILVHGSIVDRQSMLNWKQELLFVKGDTWQNHIETYSNLHEEILNLLNEETKNIEGVSPINEYLENSDTWYLGNPNYSCICKFCSN